MERRICLLSVLLLAGCGEQSSAPPPTAPTKIIPTPPVSAVPEADLYVLAVGGNGFQASMGLPALRGRYGEAAISLQPVPLGEGDSEAGAIIHAEDPTRRAYVHFLDADPQTTISAIHIRDPQSKWTGPLGIRMGTSSVELERINGKPFRFLGFGWDYGGFVSDWTRGNLAKAFLDPGRLALRLAPPALAQGESLPEGYPQGDGEFTSDIPPVRARPPVVVEFGLGFVPKPADAPSAEGDAPTQETASASPAQSGDD
ncbi:MAG: hypothetical protein IT479_11880 [Xanthomonadales bacterium]|nr:hypothetical protein [Xanthomonadales bacterium]MCE7930941.1 hypothetical protein [Xanthomonadales bacterium PRO6]